MKKMIIEVKEGGVYLDSRGDLEAVDLFGMIEGLMEAYYSTFVDMGLVDEAVKDKDMEEVCSKLRQVYEDAILKFSINSDSRKPH